MDVLAPNSSCLNLMLLFFLNIFHYLLSYVPTVWILGTMNLNFKTSYKGLEHKVSFGHWQSELSTENPVADNLLPMQQRFFMGSRAIYIDWIELHQLDVRIKPFISCFISLAQYIYIYPFKRQSRLQQTTNFEIFSPFSTKIRYDISWESSASRRFSWNIILNFLFLKKRQNLKSSSAANYRWRFKGLHLPCQKLLLCLLLKPTA